MSNAILADGPPAMVDTNPTRIFPVSPVHETDV